MGKGTLFFYFIRFIDTFLLKFWFLGYKILKIMMRFIYVLLGLFLGLGLMSCKAKIESESLGNNSEYSNTDALDNDNGVFLGDTLKSQTSQAFENKVDRYSRVDEGSAIMQNDPIAPKKVTENISVRSDEIFENGVIKTDEEIKPVLPADLPIKDTESPIVFNKVPDHSLWTQLLKKYVSDKGHVNYKGMKSDEILLESYLKTLEGPFDMKKWSTYEKLAFWINVYNAYTVHLVLENYPIKSITQIYDGKPWSQSFVLANDTYYSLDDIQKKIIMKQFGDPRIHFAINCAAKSCPPLANKAFTKDNIESMLEMRTKVFINNSDFNVINSKNSSLSKIFDWYASDFDDVIDFVNKYSSIPLTPKVKITYTEYDWALNGH